MHTIDDLLQIMSRLRDPDNGCPWDLKQSYETIVPHTLEEAYEVADAIARSDFEELRDELGDLLFQVVFYAQIAREEGRFEFEQVVEAICDKLIRRHPHVFGDEQVQDAEHQTRAWEAHKERERATKAQTQDRPHSTLDGVSIALPALSRAQKLQRRAARVGFDWPGPQQVVEKLEEEINEYRQEAALGADPQRIEDEIGDLLFTCVNLARHVGLDAESALRKANEKFERRFRAMEQVLEDADSDIRTAGMEQMDAAWETVKRGEQ
jgi:ATP diphosphatase